MPFVLAGACILSPLPRMVSTVSERGQFHSTLWHLEYLPFPPLPQLTYWPLCYPPNYPGNHLIIRGATFHATKQHFLATFFSLFVPSLTYMVFCKFYSRFMCFYANVQISIPYKIKSTRKWVGCRTMQPCQIWNEMTGNFPNCITYQHSWELTSNFRFSVCRTLEKCHSNLLPGSASFQMHPTCILKLILRQMLKNYY